MSDFYSERPDDGSGTGSGVAHHGDEFLFLDFVDDRLLLGENLEHGGHHPHEGEAGAEPEDLEGEVADDDEQLVAGVDELVKSVVLVVLD